MLVQHALDMIQANKKSLAAFESIDARMYTGEIPPDFSKTILGNRETIARQEDPSKFGPVFCYEGARDAELSEHLSHIRPVFRREVAKIRLNAVRELEDKCAKIIARHFPSRKQQKESK